MFGFLFVVCCLFCLLGFLLGSAYVVFGGVFGGIFFYCCLGILRLLLMLFCLVFLCGFFGGLLLLFFNCLVLGVLFYKKVLLGFLLNVLGF